MSQEKLIAKLNSKKFLFIFLLATAFITSYWRVPFLFFQQDEILGFGLFIKDGVRIILNGLGADTVRHFVPVTMSISYSIYSLFGLKYWIYNVVSLVFHLANGFLIYLIAKKIFKNKISIYLSPLVFFSSSVAAELVMWPVINLNVISLTFCLLAWLKMLNDIELKADGKIFWRGVTISIFFLLSMFSVEYSAGFILFIPMFVFLISKWDLKSKLKYLTPFIITSLGYLFVRFIPILSNGEIGVSLINGKPFLLTKIIGLILRYFSQALVGQNILLLISNFIGKTFYGFPSPNIFTEIKIFPFVSGSLGVATAVIFYYMYREAKKVNLSYSKHFLLSIALIALSSLPFLLVPGEAGNFGVFSSRYLYFGLVGVAFFVAFASDILIQRKKYKLFDYIFLLTLIYIVSGVYQNSKRAAILYTAGMERFGILSKIISNYSSLPPKVIFYTQSDKSYFGLSENKKILPFQSGLGQTLLLFYSEKERFPKNFYPGDYLWEIESQGYKEFDGKGFGYYRDFDKLKEAVKAYKLPSSSIISFSWEGETHKLTDISDRIRHEIF